MKLRWRSRRNTATSAPASAAADDLDLDEDLLDDETTDAASPGAASGPVMLTLTTRAEIEKAEEQAATKATNPPMIRRRLERGAFGGAVSPGGDGHAGGACGPGGCG